MPTRRKRNSTKDLAPAMGSPAGPEVQGGRPKDPDKHAAILAAARDLFLGGGFDGASMDRIARDAGVSKATLYSHFADKEALFSACILGEVERSQLPMPPPPSDPRTADPRPLAKRLDEFGRALLGLLSRPDIHQFGRLLAAQSLRHPRLAQLFYDAGPKSVCEALAGLLDDAHRRGELVCPDPAAAADHLVCMWKGMHHMRQELGLEGPRSPRQIAAHVARCTELFLRAHRS